MFKSSKANDAVIIKIDPTTGYAEFPQPGDAKKHLLPIFIDPEECNIVPERIDDRSDRDFDNQVKDFWMPDRLCKLCYGCEDAFTMYRRKHHCRMCGQIFCNQCSSHYIDGVRACRLCYDQLSEQNDRDNTLFRRRVTASPFDSLSDTGRLASNHVRDQKLIGRDKQSEELEIQKQFHLSNLQNRASAHFEAIVGQLVDNSAYISKRRNEAGESQSQKWKSTIIALVREVVSSVDPNVRKGDSLDVQPYVKLKIIPGGSMDECAYVDGVVFRKTVSHKKMMAPEISSHDENSTSNQNPRILLLAGGIDFQRADARMTSLDTLVEQEDRYLKILVEKIMSLKPTVILVGKAVARRAQELLCDYTVAVMQNVKPQLLERISRMTGAMMLPSTDHMIQQYGEECLGSCALFWLRCVMDDPEKIDPARPQRVLRAPISRGSTYAYLQGCPPELGCTLVLRGASREILSEVENIISFCIVLAYHLRLEVAYYNDRFAQLPASNDEDWLSDDSDDDECDDDDDPEVSNFNRSKRYLLSTSLDVDPRIPYKSELRGLPPGLASRTVPPKQSRAQDHQTILVTSMLMGSGDGRESKTQKSKPEIMGIRFYSNRDMALGQFLVDNCFQLRASGSSASSAGERKDAKERENGMLDQTLSYAHRPGRIDITVHRIGESSSATCNTDLLSSQQGGGGGPFHAPIFMHSFCKECDKVVTPEIAMSDETWKMSFGKFLEICFYNKSARGRTYGCTHCIRDSHVLHFSCDGLTARFDFTPIHPYALHVRAGMTFPSDFHNKSSLKLLLELPDQFSLLFESFRRSISVVQLTAEDVLCDTLKSEDLAMVLADLAEIDEEMLSAQHALHDDVCRSLLFLLRAQKMDVLEENEYDSGVGGGAHVSDEQCSEKEREELRLLGFEASSTPHTHTHTHSLAVAHTAEGDSTMKGGEEQSSELLARYPMLHRRGIFLKSLAWNMRIDTIQRFLEGSTAAALHHLSLGAMGGVMLPTFSFQSSLFAVPEEKEEKDRDGSMSSRISSPPFGSLGHPPSLPALKPLLPHPSSTVSTSTLTLQASHLSAGVGVGLGDTVRTRSSKSSTSSGYYTGKSSKSDIGVMETVDLDTDQHESVKDPPHSPVPSSSSHSQGQGQGFDTLDTLHIGTQDRGHRQSLGIDLDNPHAYVTGTSSIGSAAVHIGDPDEEDEDDIQFGRALKSSGREGKKDQTVDGRDVSATSISLPLLQNPLKNLILGDASTGAASLAEALSTQSSAGSDQRDVEDNIGVCNERTIPLFDIRSATNHMNSLSASAAVAIPLSTPIAVPIYILSSSEGREVTTSFGSPSSSASTSLEAFSSSTSAPYTAIGAIGVSGANAEQIWHDGVRASIDTTAPSNTFTNNQVTGHYGNTVDFLRVPTDIPLFAVSQVQGPPHCAVSAPTSTTSSLSKSLIENEKRIEKERQTKQNRLSKAFARLVLGGGAASGGTGESKVRVPLGVFGDGRLALAPGRKGEVISVHEDELSTIIAYSLASQEYHDKLQEFVRGEQDSGDFEYSPTYDGGWGAPYGSANQSGPSSSSSVRKFEDSSGGPGGDFSDSRAKSNLGSGPNAGTFEEGTLDHDADREHHSSHRLKERSDSMDLDFEDDLDREVLSSTGEAGPKRTVSRDSNLHLNNRGFDADGGASPSSGTKAPVGHLPTRHEDVVKSNYGISTGEIPSSVVSTRDEVVRAFSAHGTSSTENILSPIFPSKPNNRDKEKDKEKGNVEDGMGYSGEALSNSTTIPFLSGNRSYSTKDITDKKSNVKKDNYVIESDHPLSAQNTRFVKPLIDQNPTSPLALSEGHSQHNASSGAAPSPHSPDLSLKPPESQSMIMILAAKSANEKQLTSQRKSHIRHRFEDVDEKGNTLCKFVINVFWASQFEAVREGYFGNLSSGQSSDHNAGFIRSLSMSSSWVVQGGKSGASFSKSLDDRFIVKVVISRVELQMFLEFAPAYFEYMAKAFYNNIPTVLCKILGVYTLGFHNKETGKKTMENVVVMENIFYKRNITHVFDLKGSSRARYVNVEQQQQTPPTAQSTGTLTDKDSAREKEKEKGRVDGIDEALVKRRKARRLKAAIATSEHSKKSSALDTLSSSKLPTLTDPMQIYKNATTSKNKSRNKNKGKNKEPFPPLSSQVLLDDNLMERTHGRPFPLKHKAKTFFSKAVSNDTFFLSIISVVDYSILVGFDEDSHEIVVGIIDYMRQYDIVKRVERMGKSVGMLTGQAEPTIIQPPMYKKRFNAAMERYFMTVPDKWVSHDV